MKICVERLRSTKQLLDFSLKLAKFQIVISNLAAALVSAVNLINKNVMPREHINFGQHFNSNGKYGLIY